MMAEFRSNVSISKHAGETQPLPERYTKSAEPPETSTGTKVAYHKNYPLIRLVTL